MAPLHFETGLLHIVGHVLLAIDGVLVTGEETATVAVALAVVGGGRESPRPFGIDFTDELEVHLVAEGKVVAAVTQIETALGLVAVGRHDESAAVTLREGEEAVGDSKRQGYIGHHEVGRTEHHLLAGLHLAAR